MKILIKIAIVKFQDSRIKNSKVKTENQSLVIKENRQELKNHNLNGKEKKIQANRIALA